MVENLKSCEVKADAKMNSPVKILSMCSPKTLRALDEMPMKSSGVVSPNLRSPPARIASQPAAGMLNQLKRSVENALEEKKRSREIQRAQQEELPKWQKVLGCDDSDNVICKGTNGLKSCLLPGNSTRNSTRSVRFSPFSQVKLVLSFDDMKKAWQENNNNQSNEQESVTDSSNTNTRLLHEHTYEEALKPADDDSIFYYHKNTDSVMGHMYDINSCFFMEPKTMRQYQGHVTVL